MAPAAQKTWKIELDREEDGRWIAEIRGLPGVMVYGKTKDEAVRKVYALALRVLADQMEAGDASSAPQQFTVSLACSR
jgi:predicted RNase H-like HicB family nuclease